MNEILETYKFIIVFKDPNEQTNFLDIMNKLDIPEEFSEQIANDIIKNKCDKKDLIEILDNAIFNETWNEYRKVYQEKIHSDLIKEKLSRAVENKLDEELHNIPNCGYYSVIEYSNDDFCYEILKQLMSKLKFIYRAISED